MTQDDTILAHLQSGSAITPAEAAERWSILALHSAIARLRKRGYVIACRIMTSNGRRWGEYKISA